MSSGKTRESKRNPDDTIKILIATDIHLGFEYNKKRGQQTEDSFITFEEILQCGINQDVDFILLGGDLFHDTKPPQTVMLKCMELLRKYCLGSKEIKIQFLSDPEIVFRHCANKVVNYEDPNINISMPVFSIHGNHDDPSFGAVGSMDLLSVSGLINYFGKWTDLTKITVPPITIKKGETHLALYGLSYINDQRLSRLLRDFKLDMSRPQEIPDCFNIFVIHQNRSPHSEHGYISQSKLPDFLNLVIWGHEHECRITPEHIPETTYYVSQPGSSIATSLSEGESKPKHIGILSVNKTQFKLQSVKLETVRPFVFDNLILQDENIPKSYTEQLSESVYKFVDNYIENELIPKASIQLSGHPKQPILPLLRLRIFYSSEEEIFDANKLAQRYCDEVANPMDMVVFRKQKVASKHSKLSSKEFGDEFEEMAQILCYEDEKNWNRTVQGGIKKHFSLEENKDKLTVLSVNGLNEALNRFVDIGDTDAFANIVNHQIKKTMAYLETCEVDTAENIRNEIKNFRDKRMEEEQEETAEIQSLFNNIKGRTQTNIDKDNNLSDDENRNMPVSKRGRGRGRGRGSTRQKQSIDVNPSKQLPAKRQTKKQDQNVLDDYVSSSRKNNKKEILFIEDSD
ncbi:double-strand break repair protein MRE11 isoform X1 [Frieseomelitta varia]|uniref:double-strand break repair protein MRE11 isoform X1 n=1 Tax=Frieseomelitta varia TaxID=561572 RepID=UPI001CB69879|nr:double-strand break repair protein MRE11 isoform X1 [Frieseomelitta varia]